MESLLLYVGADNDLSPYLRQDLDELKGLPVSQYIQVDQRLQGWGDTKPNSYRILRKEGGETETLLDYELNTGDPETLRGFLEWSCAEGAKLEDSLFIFWGHGEGWIGCCKDYLDEDRLDLAEIHHVFSGLTFQAVGFDACIMASVEVLDVTAESTDILVASQEIEPKTGWRYTDLNLRASDPVECFDAMARGYIGQSSQRPLCLALLRLARYSELIEHLNSVLERAGARLESVRSRLDVLPRLANGEYVDLWNLLVALQESIPDQSAACASARALIEEDLVMRNYTTDPRYRGISLWLPRSIRSYKLERYGQQPFARSCPAHIRLLSSYTTRKDQPVPPATAGSAGGRYGGLGDS